MSCASRVVWVASLLNLDCATTLAQTTGSSPNGSAPSGSWTANFRERLETVDDDGLDATAYAHTARLRLGWRQPLGAGLEALVEAEGIVELNRHFNSGANRQTTFPLVPDARATELNQALLGWKRGEQAVQLGRQRITLDNQRFVGNVGWRQNEQTFDALSIQGKPLPALSLRYSWLDRVHRVNGDQAIDRLARERRLDAHLLNLGWAANSSQLLTGYAYLVEDQDVASASSRSIGLRWTGTVPGDQSQWGWTLEGAQQQDHANNPGHFSHRYLLLEPSFSHAGLTWKLGLESLGGNGSHAFQTPLATLHAFNGWADKFLVTPPNGLRDLYFGSGAKFGHGAWQDRFNWALVWHDFSAQRGGQDYGREWDASVGVALGHGWQGLAKLADYRSRGFARDTRKFWLQFEWTH